MPDIRVLIAEDEGLMRQALTLFVDSADSMKVVGEAKNGIEVIAKAKTSRPHVILMDLKMPEVGGVQATRTLSAEYPEVKILAMTAFSGEHCVVAALRAGASGYLVKDIEPDELIAAIRDVRAGSSVISPQITHSLLASVKSLDDYDQFQHTKELLIDRERSVVELVGRGMSNKEIAQAMHLSESSVKANLGSVMRKWNVRDRVQVLLEAARRGYVML